MEHKKINTVNKMVLADAKGSVVISREIGDVGMQNPTTYAPYGLGENDSSWGYNGAFRSQLSELYLLGKGNRAYLANYGIMSRSDRTPPERAGINPYRYCTGNPVNFSDPTGNEVGVKWRAGFGIFLGIAAIGLAIPTAGASVGLFAGEVSFASGILATTEIALGTTAVGLSSSSMHLEKNADTDEAHERALKQSNAGLVLGFVGAALAAATLAKTVGGKSWKIGTRADILPDNKERKRKKKHPVRKRPSAQIAEQSGLSRPALAMDRPGTLSLITNQESSLVLKAEGNPQRREINLIRSDGASSLYEPPKYANNAEYFDSEMSDTLSEYSDDYSSFDELERGSESDMDAPQHSVTSNTGLNALKDASLKTPLEVIYDQPISI